MLRACLSLLVFACSIQAACTAIQGREILAGDLAKIDTAFSKLNPAIAFSYAPAAGTQRIVTGSEIDKWAAMEGLEGVHSPEMCFERVAHAANRDDILHAIAELFGSGYEDLRIEVVEVCPCDIPAGRIELPLDGVSAPSAAHPETPVLWRGRVVSPDGTAYPIWARVRVLASITVIRAAETLRAGQAITRQELESVKITASPLAFRKLQTIAAYEGKIMNTSLVRGSILKPTLVHVPSDVERGSVVKVSVLSGSAHLALEARADTAGNVGQNITVTNPMGAARFQATVTGPGRAEIVLDREKSVSPYLAPIARQMRTTDSGGGL